MTATLEAIPQIGSTKPREYTPPLGVHCTGPKSDPGLHPAHPLYDVPQECLCGCGLNPRTSWGFSCVDFLENICKWKLMPWQKWLYIHSLEKAAPGRTGFRFQTIIVLVSRQNGKTTWLKGIGLWRLFLSPVGETSPSCPGAKIALIACQSLDYAEGILKEAVDDIRNSAALRPELINHKVTNGKNRLILTNNRFWRAATATRKGGRSLSVDIAMLDELREHVTWDAFDAISPTTLVRPYGQVVCTSNAGDERSEVLRSLRDAAMQRITAGDTETTSDGLFEWSLPPDVDPSNPRYWHISNPSIGLLNTFTIDTMRGRFETMRYKNLPGFLTEYQCVWVDALEPGIIPAQHWADTTDHTNTSKRAEGTPVYAALDVNYQRSRSYVSIAARRADGLLHTEVIAAAAGTDWVIPWLVERKARFKGVAIQKTGAPVSGMLDDMKRARIPVVEWGPGTEVVGGTGLFYDLICEHKIVHRPAPVLDRAAASGIGRNVVDGFVFDRRNSPVDVSPLIACAAAAWLENRPATGTAQVHEWPSDEEIAKWEAQGRAAAHAFEEPTSERWE